MIRSLLGRLAAIAVLVLLTLGVGKLVGFTPNLPAVIATVAVVAAVGWLLADAVVVGDDVPWQPAAAAPYFLPGRDPKLTAYSQVIADHLSSTTPSDALRGRLRSIAAAREAASPEARLPPRVREALAGDDRLTLTTISSLLDDIEGLP